MPIIGSFSGAAAKGFGFLKTLLARITDTFNRTTSGSLGTTADGVTWTAVDGVWYCNGSQAQSDTSASTYATAIVPFRADVTLTALTTNGTGVVFWETGSGDWWATVPYEYTGSESYCIPSSCCTGDPGGDCIYASCCRGSLNECVSNDCCTTTDTCQYSACCSSLSGTVTLSRNACRDNYTGYYYFDPCGVANWIPCGSGTVSVYYACCQANTCCTGRRDQCVANPCCTTKNSCVADACCGRTANTCTYSSCCSVGSRTRYYWAINLLKRISGVVTQVQSTDISNSLTDSNPISGIKTITSGVGITTKAYSDTGLTSQIGSDVTYTATGATTGTNVGIIKAPSTVNQGSTLDSFDAS